MKLSDKFIALALQELGYQSLENLFENLYLQAFIDTFQKVNKTERLEEKIRDVFVRDLETKNPLTQDLLEEQVLILT